MVQTTWMNIWIFPWGENQAVDGNTHRNVKYVVVIMLFKSRFRLEVSPPKLGKQGSAPV